MIAEPALTERARRPAAALDRLSRLRHISDQ
jgi:hypothetical protein